MATHDTDRIRLKPEDRPVEERTEIVESRTAGERIRVRHEDEDLQTKLELPEALNLRLDRIRWGPVLFGVFTAVTSMLLLSLLGLAVGLTATEQPAGDLTGGALRNTAIWAGVAAIIAFFIGGFVAGGTAAVFDRGWGALNGLAVFLVGLPLILWLTTAGLGAALGIAGNYAAAFNIDPAQVGTAAQAAPAAPVGQAQAATWSLLGGLLLTAAAAALGGALATRRKVSLDRATGTVVRD